MDQAPTSPRGPSRRLVIASVISTVVVVVAGVLAFGNRDDDPDGGTVDLSDPTGQVELEEVPTDQALPALTFTTFDGDEQSFADYRGKPIVVNFFASWCAPCVAEMPEIEQVHQELGDEVHFIGFSFNDPRDEAQKIVDQTGVTYTIADDTDGTLFEALGATAMPTTVFVTADGQVSSLRSGRITESQLREKVEALLEDPRSGAPLP